MQRCAGRRHLRGRGADLQVRRARSTQRAGAEERTARVRRPATGLCDDTTRWTVERNAGSIDHACFGEHGHRVLTTGNQELVARRFERALSIGPDLRVDPKVSQRTEGRPGDRGLSEIEVERELSSAEKVHGARRMQERRDLGEPVAASRRGDRRELRARRLDERCVAHRRASVPITARRPRVRASDA